MAKISDFGLSLKVEPLQASLRGSVTGTGPYIAPEVLANGTRSAAADIYAFGITLWEMVTGGEPLAGVPKVMLAQQVVLNNLRPTFPAGVPPGFVALAQRCWAARPAARPTFAEILTHLRLLMDEGPTEIPPVPAEALQIQSCAEEASWRDLSVISGSRETSPSLRLSAMQTPVERMLDLLETLLHGGDVDVREVRDMCHTCVTHDVFRAGLSNGISGMGQHGPGFLEIVSGWGRPYVRAWLLPGCYCRLVGRWKGTAGHDTDGHGSACVRLWAWKPRTAACVKAL